MNSDKPLGVIFIAIIYILIAAAGIIGGIALMTPIGLTYVQTLTTVPLVGTIVTSIIQYLSIIGVLAIIVGIVLLITAIGLIMLQEWSWTLAVLISIILIIAIIGIVFLWYLYKDETKSAFGK
ncbi:MAG: hypothetical protein ACTSX4_13115 [Candidatus Helarchaeota archaeon]